MLNFPWRDWKDEYMEQCNTVFCAVAFSYTLLGCALFGFRVSWLTLWIIGKEIQTWKKCLEINRLLY